MDKKSVVYIYPRYLDVTEGKQMNPIFSEIFSIIFIQFLSQPLSLSLSFSYYIIIM